jgi:L-fuculose-phosphate aldolase
VTTTAWLAQRREVVAVCRALWDAGLIAGPDGNVSVRLGPDRVLATPSGASKRDLAPSDLVVCRMDGTPVRRRGAATPRPSSELGLHLRAYARRPDVAAVVHAHPPTATGFGVAGEDLTVPVLPEVILQMGTVPLVPYATPGTPAVADGFEPYWAAHDVFLMANHGALALGPTLTVAHQRMESLEHAARIMLAARQLGRVRRLAARDVAALEARRAAEGKR